MEHRDLIKDQIEQLGRVLARILSDFMGFKSKGKAAIGIEIANENLKGELDLDIDTIINLNGEELSSYLLDKKLSPAHIEKLIDYITEIAEHRFNIEKTSGIIVYRKILDLYEMLNKLSKTYSFERKHKVEYIKQILKSNE